MRLVLPLAALLALAIPSAGRAAEKAPRNNCGQICAKAEVSCHQECDLNQHCKSQCDKDLKSCRKACELGVRHGNDQQRLMREMKKLALEVAEGH